MQFLINSRLTEGTTNEQFIEYVMANPPADAWELIRQRVIKDLGYKVGDQPGVIAFLEAESQEAAEEIVAGLPLAETGLVTFEVDPISPLARF